MTIVRCAALKISSIVLRYASPGCKDWAEGLARELDFVESDWGALLWALGSLRVLFDRRPAPIRSLDELIPVIEKFLQTRRASKWLWLMATFQAGLAGLNLFSARVGSERIGFAMIAVCWIAAAIEWYRESLAMQNAVADSDPMVLFAYYKLQLEQQINNYRSLRWWTGVRVFVLLYLPGDLLAYRGRSDFILGWVGILTPLLIVMGWRSQRNARRQLQNLNELLEARP